MKLEPLHDPGKGVLRAVALMSGSGTNLRRVLEHQQKLASARGESPFRIVGIFSDNINGKAPEIGKEYDIPVFLRDIRGFYAARGASRRNMEVRAEFDRNTVDLLAPLNASLAVYAGYMSIATDVLSEAFLGVNVHPADLSVMENGRRKWVGMRTVRDALEAGESTLRSTTHLVEPVVDGGRLLMISPPLKVSPPATADLSNTEQLRLLAQEYQERLKKAGDWIIMPKTIEYIADGRYAANSCGELFFDGAVLPAGLRLDSPGDC